MDKYRKRREETLEIVTQPEKFDVPGTMGQGLFILAKVDLYEKRFEIDEMNLHFITSLKKQKILSFDEIIILIHLVREKNISPESLAEKFDFSVQDVILAIKSFKRLKMIKEDCSRDCYDASPLGDLLASFYDKREDKTCYVDIRQLIKETFELENNDLAN
ncbi:hypothetical protein ACH0BK_25305 [Priestia megaterium]|uniref:hypothetical protein n=1 Tax=Priestia megaterium TaxID=1404 RepID=UPI00387A2B2D